MQPWYHYYRSFSHEVFSKFHFLPVYNKQVAATLPTVAKNDLELRAFDLSLALSMR